VKLVERIPSDDQDQGDEGEWKGSDAPPAHAAARDGDKLERCGNSQHKGSYMQR
jgi:hypothetical protein